MKRSFCFVRIVMAGRSFHANERYAGAGVVTARSFAQARIVIEHDAPSAVILNAVNGGAHHLLTTLVEYGPSSTSKRSTHESPLPMLQGIRASNR
jgi:hypothetical protein